MHPSQPYVDWLDNNGYRHINFTLSFVELDIIVSNVIREYHQVVTPELKERLTLIYEDKYLDNASKHEMYQLRCKVIGKKALMYLKTEQEWYQYQKPQQFMELLNRCVIFDFKNSPEIKLIFKK